jgi:hypothetical protein
MLLDQNIASTLKKVVFLQVVTLSSAYVHFMTTGIHHVLYLMTKVTFVVTFLVRCFSVLIPYHSIMLMDCVFTQPIHCFLLSNARNCIGALLYSSAQSLIVKYTVDTVLTVPACLLLCSSVCSSLRP